MEEMVAVEREIRNSLRAIPSEGVGHPPKAYRSLVSLGELDNVVKQAIDAGSEEIEQIYNAAEERLRS